MLHLESWCLIHCRCSIDNCTVVNECDDGAVQFEREKNANVYVFKVVLQTSLGGYSGELEEVREQVGWSFFQILPPPQF